MTKNEIENAFAIFAMGGDLVLAGHGLPPAFSGLQGIVKMVFSTREAFLEEKLVAFFEAAGKIPTEERDKLLKELAKDNPKFGASLLIIVDRTENVRKATLLGKLFGATLNGRITTKQFERFASMIEKTFSENLEYLINVGSTHIVGGPDSIAANPDINYQLASVGLMKYLLLPPPTFAQDDAVIEARYEVTEAGSIIASICSE